MIAHTPDIEGQLQRLARAGADGLLLGEVPTGTAILLALQGQAAITTERPQRVVITGQGAAFARRSVFA